MGPGTSDYNLGVDPYTASLVTTLTVCLGGGLRSPSALLVCHIELNLRERTLKILLFGSV